MIRCVVEIPCEHDQRMGFHITGEGIPVLLTDAMIHFRTNTYTPDRDAPSHCIRKMAPVFSARNTFASPNECEKSRLTSNG